MAKSTEYLDLKQVIVMRADLNMRKGKMISQGAHAALAFVRKRLLFGSYGVAKLALQDHWLNESQKKITVRCDSEEELLQIFERAQKAGLTVELIRDAGHTEFHGVPTLTCLCIGPEEATDIDKITGDLKLL